MTAKEQNDFFYVCSLIEYVARITKNRRGVVVEKLGEKGIRKQLHDAEVNHCLTFEQVGDEIIEWYRIPEESLTRSRIVSIRFRGLWILGAYMRL